MKQKDLTEAFYDKMMSILFDYIKDFIDWKEVGKVLPRNIIWYTTKQRCQIILAIADAFSFYGRKFRMIDTNSRVDILSEYIYNFRPTRCASYMKAYRKSFLIDIFGVFLGASYDKILKHAKFSYDDSLQMIKTYVSDLIIKSVGDIESDTKTFLKEAKDETDYKLRSETIMSVCTKLEEVTSLFSTNCKRIDTQLAFLLFDIQSLYNVAFDPSYEFLQNKKYDEFEMKKKQKCAGDIISAIMKTIHDIVESAYKSETVFDTKAKAFLKVHKIAILEDNDDICEMKIAHYDPLIVYA